MFVKFFQMLKSDSFIFFLYLKKILFLKSSPKGMFIAF